MPEDGEEKSSVVTAKDEADDDDERDEDAATKKAGADADADAGDEDEDEDEDEEGDEDEDEAEARPSPPPKKPVARAAPERPKPKPQRRGPPVKAQLPPEKQINAPSGQTLLLLGVMAFSTLAMWGSARFACNAHPAQTRKPRDVSTAELSRDPKDAALEMQQRWNSYDFKGALELAKGPIAEEIQKAKADCEKNASDCESKRKAQADKVLATAALLSRGPAAAKVRVISRGGASGEQTVVYALEQEGSAWKVSQKTTPDAAPAPVPSPMFTAPQPTPPTPPASVAPPGHGASPPSGLKLPVKPKSAP